MLPENTENKDENGLKLVTELDASSNSHHFEWLIGIF